MKNPWLDLPKSAPFVLAGDSALVAQHNAHPKCERKQTGRINLKLRPVPYIGDPKAPVVLLTLNPGDKPGDELGEANDIYRRMSKANLNHEAGYYILHPELPACPGKSYARWQVKALLQRFDTDVLCEKLFLAQYMPYHSNEYVDTKTLFPSQRYTFSLIENAVARGALIVVLRSKALWLRAVPALRTYRNLVECSNPRSPTVSPGSLSLDFERVVHAIAEA
ncbi:MAG: hypothetical protein SGJ26_10735 [Nitrospirota bacterium]|nr:hypothetical protein [Nitrospirota bacterium]